MRVHQHLSTIIKCSIPCFGNKIVNSSFGPESAPAVHKSRNRCSKFPSSLNSPQNKATSIVMFQQCLKRFGGSFKGVSRVFNEFSRKFQANVSNKIQASFKHVSSVFQVRLMSFLREIKGFKGIAKKIRKFQWCFKSVSRKYIGVFKVYK